MVVMLRRGAKIGVDCNMRSLLRESLPHDYVVY